MDLSQVSQTAILTLIARVVVSEKENAILNDPMAVLCLERLMSISSEEEKNRMIKWKKMYARIQAHDAKPVARRTKIIDSSVDLFISNNPKCTVVNLACGFDTRFWRIQNKDCRYIEIDLPEVVALKREILKDELGYELMGCSILDTSWIDKVTSNGNSGFLLLAEGLFYYLPRQDVTGILQAIARRFDRSQLILDMAPEKFTKGLWKRLMQLEGYVWGLDVSFVSGMNDPRDIESYANGFKVIGVEKGNVGPIITVSIQQRQTSLP
jgi:O-methyltransferase involved in polyketide biosynthesis